MSPYDPDPLPPMSSPESSDSTTTRRLFIGIAVGVVGILGSGEPVAATARQDGDDDNNSGSGHDDHDDEDDHSGKGGDDDRDGDDDAADLPPT